MKKLLLLFAIVGLFSSCSKSSNNNVSPTPTPVAAAHVYITNYYIDPYNPYQVDVVCTNSGNATAYNVSIRIYTYSGSYYNNYYLTASSVAPGETVSGSVNCGVYYPYTFYYTVYTPTWN